MGLNYKSDHIDLLHLNRLFLDPVENQNVIADISSEYKNNADLIMSKIKSDLIFFYISLSKNDVDIEFVKKKFRAYFSFGGYTRELRGLNMKYDHLIFSQAFSRNPEKFKSLKDLIPSTLASMVRPLPMRNRLIFNSVGNEVTENSILYAHQLVVGCEICDHRSGIIFLPLGQNDDYETQQLYSSYPRLGGFHQNPIDLSILDEDLGSRTDWEIKLFDSKPRVEKISRINVDIFYLN